MAERDIDTLNTRLKEFHSLYEEFKGFSLQQLTSYVKRLDEKAGVDTTSFKFEKYNIAVNEIQFSQIGLPKIISEKLSSGKASAELDRGQGFLELKLVDSEGQNTVGVELRINRLSETKVSDSGIFLQTPAGELEIDSDMEEAHGIIDQVFNHSEYIRVMAADAIFSKVIEGLLADTVTVNTTDEPEKPNFAWVGSPHPKTSK